MWILTILAHLFSNTGYSVLLRNAASVRKVDPLFLAAIMTTAIAIPAAFAIFIAKIDWSLLDLRLALMYIATIVLTLGFHMVNPKALELTEASVFAFIFNIRLGFVTLIGIFFLGEPVVGLRLVGGALVFVAGFMLAGKAVARPISVFYSILSAVISAVFTAFEKYMITEVGYATYVFPSALIIAALMWAIVLAGKRPIDKGFITSKGFGALLVFRCISAYGFTLSLILGAFFSVATYISALNCITTPIVAVLILKETDNLPKKIAAGVIALAGATLIFLANR